MLNEVKFKEYKIIFTTASDEYAIKAFKFNTADYLLKLILIDDLIAAEGKIHKGWKTSEYLDSSQISNLSNSVLGKHPMNFLTISGSDRIDFIDPKEIIYMQSNGCYTELILSNNKRKIMVSKSLGEFEGLLNSALFLRIHNTYIVTLSHLININKKYGNYHEMSNGDALPILKRRYECLMKYPRNT